jgi:hypothetical protein
VAEEADIEVMRAEKEAAEEELFELSSQIMPFYYNSEDVIKQRVKQADYVWLGMFFVHHTQTYNHFICNQFFILDFRYVRPDF